MTDVGRATAARRRRVARIVAGVLALAALAAAVVAPGFDEREADPVDPTVWALQTGTGQRYARVNTEIAEVDTVKDIDNPSQIVQHADRLLLLSASLTAVTALDAGRPVDVTATSVGTVPTPAGTTAVASQGDVVAYLAADGDVLTGRISDGTAVAPIELVADDGTGLRAVAIAVAADGSVAAFSPLSGGVVRAGVDGVVVGVDAVPDAPSDGAFQLTYAAGEWALLDAETGRLWREGADGPIATGVDADARLQRASTGTDLHVADGRGLVVVRPSGEAARVFGSEAQAGAPAAPVELDGVTYAAWLPAGEGQGSLWSSAGPTLPLDYAGGALPERREVTLRSNGSRMVLNESRSGWVWEVPSGQLVRSSQDWVPEERTSAEADDEDQSAEVREPRAPVAVDDALGVRPGRQVRLPVLLNDYDANGDVLTIDPASVVPPDPGFGVVHVADDGQALVIDVTPDAAGSVAFDYAVTDGTSEDGLRSPPATVTVSVADGAGAPEWCGVEGCVAVWPSPQVEPGGTVAVEVLDGWVDPEGDPMYLLSAVTAEPGVSLAASPEGRLVIRHAGESGAATVDVTVADSTGATAERTLDVRVVASPRLAMEPVAVTALADVRTEVPIADHVTGAVGTVVVIEASVDPADGAGAEPTPDGAGVLFRADRPGTYAVAVTIADGTSQTRGSIRMTVIAPGDEALATVPLTAFVRPQEDVTVDVLGAVTNPGGRVLLLSEAAVDPSPGARVSASIVGHGALRLSGTTGDGRPGVWGVVSYTVSDGSGRAAMTVRGEVTVILLDAAVPAAPLAADDAITVRAGGQVDVRVLANDVAAAGAVVALDAGSVSSPAGGGLAFPAGPVIRILAGEEPGTFRIPYSSYILGYPSQSDAATLVVTVTDGDENAPPAPRDLSGRASSGEPVRLPFDGAGLDPDGDGVRLDAIVTQPTNGAARLSADGTALLYTSAVGFSGQDEFTYQVVDDRGRRATATVRLGVVASDADPAPVTYTDFVQVQAASGRRVAVTPLANDVDLAGGDLELIEVRPDAPEGTAEHAALAALMPVDANGPDRLAQGLLTFEVGDQVGTSAFLYSVRNEVGSIAQGRIVIKAVRERVVDVPVVADTVLGAETREAFPRGVGVLDGTVTWASGDADSLALSLWGEPDDVTIDGARIAGPLPERTRLIPFRVSGVDFAGEIAVGYGFLRVLGDEDIRVALRDDAGIEVAEDASVTVDVATLAAIAPGAAIELDGAQIRAGGAREQATCAPAGGTRVRYSAGIGAPYADTCLVAARLTGQSAWTLLPVPVTVVPVDPVPALVSASLEIAPGDSAVFDLEGMVRWPVGATAREVELASTYSGQMFEVSRSGTRVTLTARDDALPGRAESVTVSLADHPQVRPKALSLIVGPAPSELPKGGSVVQTCTQSAGEGCTLTVVGAPGEVNPLPGTPLEVVTVTSADDCPDVRFEVAGSGTVRASWAQDAPGGVCDAVFAVRDAQGRVSAAERSGTISLDLQGYPQGPARLAQVAYGDGTLELAVDPGSAAGAYPAITGFDVMAGGSRVATCTPTGACTPLAGLVNGAKRSYAAYAVNAVGRSRDAATVTAWAYAPPAPPVLVSWAPAVTSGDGQRIDLVVDIADSTTQALRVSAGDSVQSIPVGAGEQRLDAVAIGSNTPVEVTLTPLTGLDLPPVEGAGAAGESVRVTANGIGRPAIVSATHAYTQGEATATITATATSGGSGSTTWVGAAVAGPCRPDRQASGGVATFTVPVSQNATNTVTVCAESRVAATVYGTAAPVQVTFAAFTDPGAPVLLRGYRVADACLGAGTSCTTALERDPQWRPESGTELWYRGSGGATSTTFGDVLVAGRAVDVVAYYCVDFGGGQRTCSDQTTPAIPESGPPYRPTVTFAACTVGTPPTATLGGNAADFAVASTMLDAAGEPTNDPAAMRQAHVTASFQAALAGMPDWTSATVTCGGAPPPDSGAGAP